MKLKILVGTVTHTAEFTAQAMQLGCIEWADPIEVILMHEAPAEVWDEPDTLYLICTSTYGMGDVPDNAWPLLNDLQTQSASLVHVRYGVFGLGDHASHAPTFCFAADVFDRALAARGAQRLGDIHRHDASGDTPSEDAGIAWCSQWLQTHAPQAESSGNTRA